MVDLHTHSNISDGDLSPEMLIKEAASRGLRAIALTDHDSINGLESAKTTAKLQGDIHFIPGIEININWSGTRKDSGKKSVPRPGPGGEFHLLGLGINSPSRAFIASIKELSRRREARNLQILDKMHELSIEASLEDLMAVAKHSSTGVASGYSLGRLHFAALLVEKKVVKNIDQAFSRYLGIGKPLYVPKEGLGFEEAAALIRESGGIPVLAHPLSLFIAWGRLPDLIKILKNMGLMGLEAWHPTAKAGACRRLEALAKSLGLYVTEGSDFYGSARLDRKLGYSNKSRKINDAVLEAIPELNVKDIP